MKTTVINLEGIESVLSPAGVEKQLCTHPGIHKVGNQLHDRHGHGLSR